ncbi:hypothetical protein KQY10_05790 [Leptospira interrogans]|uniref:hypothetical protein n=1 Tax=Leptospira interrogans TaxID=173 RepID=UPI00046C6ADB|nr:hypothetical protein [Leptospira interrogans]ALO01421.1 hypothetical protein LIH_13785 [Leptospira interrogans serovar Hardjo-prajitno]MCD1165130.1 hypothetical protein [Leptospira interrogans]MCH1885579.1 hypothetical protein [Leptospira interrogans]MCH1891850.1 hypothetical protein [Leptospira interrogans]MCH1899331.1 hypothetical protein [Leptospira interrogans]
MENYFFNNPNFFRLIFDSTLLFYYFLAFTAIAIAIALKYIQNTAHIHYNKMILYIVFFKSYFSFIFSLQQMDRLSI